MNIALFIGDSIQSYEMELISEAFRITQERGHRLDIFANCCVPAGDYLHIEGLKKVYYLSDLKNYDGIITADDTLNNYGMNKDLRKHLDANAKCPIICLRNSVEKYINVTFDDRREIYNMTKHVIQHHGCKRIGFVTGSFKLNDSINRLNGFKDAMQEEGLPVEEQLIFHGNYWNDQGDETADFFANGIGGLPDAVICSNDYMAIALIDSLKKLGIRCPEDIIVTGLDNVPEGAENVPSLTTIGFDMRDMVSEAVKLLEGLNEGGEFTSELKRRLKNDNNTHLLRGKCIYRSSCGCQSVNDLLVQNYKMMRDLITDDRKNAFTCVNMNMDLGGILEVDECLRTSLQILRDSGLFEHIYLIYNNRLYGEVSPGEKIKLYSENGDDKSLVVSTRYPISKARDNELDGKCNAFLPINYQDEVYGYVVLRLAPGGLKYFNIVLAQLLIILGNTLKKLELLSYQGELQDLKTLYQQDPLTGLFNRRGLERNLRRLYETELGKKKVVISSIDMDGLKQINDNLGHVVGDEAILAVADCLREVLGRKEFAARIGGDEFIAVVLMDSKADIDSFRRKMYESVEKKAKEFKDFKFSVSVGLAEAKSYRSIPEAMKKADRDMYSEKTLHHQNI